MISIAALAALRWDTTAQDSPRSSAWTFIRRSITHSSSIRPDALQYLAEYWREFDAVHASPPCQDHSPLSALTGSHGTGWLLDATRKALATVNRPSVIENVAGANMAADLLLCGGMFGLRTYRHRKFEISHHVAGIAAPAHPRHVARTATRERQRGWDAGLNMSVTGDIGSRLGGLALGIDWMTGNELSQAIPPAYTEFIGEQLLTTLEAAA